QTSRHQHVDDVRLDLHAGHEPVGRSVHVPAVGEGAANQNGATAKRIVTRDLDAHVADGRHRVGGNGEETARRPDEIDPVHLRVIGNRDVRDGGGESGYA